jgi:sugar-specific transcriptional regulator TrmB
MIAPMSSPHPNYLQSKFSIKNMLENTIKNTSSNVCSSKGYEIKRCKSSLKRDRRRTLNKWTRFQKE